ncbi:MAG: histidine kinase dimerization/phospho-acceptor domain-containing protein [Verrucomicrobiota bacterium]
MPSNLDEDKRFSFGIGIKLILTATLIMSVAVAVIGTLFHGKYVESLQEIEMTRLEQRAQELTEDLALILADVHKLAFDLGELDELGSYPALILANRRDEDAARSWMDRMRFRVSTMVRSHQHVSSVHFIDFNKNNREFFAAERINGDLRAIPERALKTWGDFQFSHRRSINGSTDIPFEFIPSNDPLEDNQLYVAIPLFVDQSKIAGAVVVSLNPLKVNDKLASRASRDEFVHVVFQDGTYLTNRNGFELGGNLTPTRRIQDIFPKIPLNASKYNSIKSGLFQDASGEHHAIGFVRFAFDEDSENRFILAYSENFDTVIENTSIAPSKAIITSAIILLFAVLLIGYLANRLVNPLRYIAKVARHYGESDEPAPLPVNASGEVGIVARSLHQMREQVEKRARALEREIAAHKATSRELEVAMEETNEAAKAKSDFLATMSHEIRTPMNGVIGMADLLAQTRLSEDQKELVNTICSSGDSLLTIINDILDFSKIESGKMELEDEPFDPNQCIEEAIDLLASNALENDVELIINVASGVPRCIRGDITRLRQIILNLLGNALKFTHRGEIEVGLRVFDNQDENYTLEFYIRDTGIVIPKEKARKTRFFLF